MNTNVDKCRSVCISLVVSVAVRLTFTTTSVAIHRRVVCSTHSFQWKQFGPCLYIPPVVMFSNFVTKRHRYLSVPFIGLCNFEDAVDGWP